MVICDGSVRQSSPSVKIVIQRCLSKRAPAATSSASAPTRWRPRAAASPRPPWSCTGRSGPRARRSRRWPSARRAAPDRLPPLRQRGGAARRVLRALRGSAPLAGRRALARDRRPRRAPAHPRSTSSTPGTRPPRRCGPTCCATRRSSPPSARRWSRSRLPRRRRAHARRRLGSARRAARRSSPRPATPSTSTPGARSHAMAAVSRAGVVELTSAMVTRAAGG